MDTKRCILLTSPEVTRYQTTGILLKCLYVPWKSYQNQASATLLHSGTSNKEEADVMFAFCAWGVYILKYIKVLLHFTRWTGFIRSRDQYAKRFLSTDINIYSNSVGKCSIISISWGYKCYYDKNKWYSYIVLGYGGQYCTV